MIGPGSRVVRNANTAYRNLATEGLVMNPSDNTLHALNEVASSVWAFIAEERPVSDIVSMVLENYDADSETVTKDVIEYLTALDAQGLLIIR